MEGIRVLHYIGDFIFCCATQEEADALRTKALQGIMELGLAPNFKKTMGVAAKRYKFLGIRH